MTDTNGSGVNMTNTKGRQTGAGIAAGLVALALLAGACGGGGDDEAAPAAAEEAAAAAEEAAEAAKPKTKKETLFKVWQ